MGASSIFVVPLFYFHPVINIHGRKTEVIARTTYQTVSGEWIAEVDGNELNSNEVCHISI